MHVESQGLWNGTDEFDDEQLGSLGDMRVEFTAAPADGNEEARYGGVCRAVTETGQSYNAFVGTDGSVGIVRFGETAPDILVLATEGAEGVVSPGGDRFRMECAGDELVYIALYVNDQLVIDALDDDPLPPGGGGMLVEAVTDQPPIPTAEVVFDDFVLAEA